MARARTATTPAGSSSPRYEVRVFGAFSVACNGIDLDVGAWPRRGRSLLRLLATAPQHRRLRDEVIDTLWPEATLEAGFANLRTVLHRVRRGMDACLPAPMVLAPGWIMLNPDCHWEIDLDRFEELARRAGDDPHLLGKAADLAAGEVLAEDRYEAWAVPVRERVFRRWREICLRQARLQRVWGARVEAVAWFEQVLESDPLDEEALQGLLGALGEAGLGSEALRRYQQFARRLERELDVPPAAETLALAASLRSDLVQGSGKSVVPVPVSTIVPSYPLPTLGALVGQGAEQERLRAALSAVGSGQTTLPHLLLLAGEAGMGKTRLLGEMARRARERGMLVLAGGCYEQEGRLPYGPIHDALMDYVRAQPEPVLRSLLETLPDLARILPEIRTRLPNVPERDTGDAESQRLRLFSEVAELLERVMVDRPMVLLLDDLQWADGATLQLLHYLLRQSYLQRLLMLGAFRDEEVGRGTMLERLIHAVDERERIQVKPLVAADLARLVTERLGGSGDEALVRTVCERSAGNPFFALQMLGLLHDEGGLLRDEDVWRLAPRVSLELPGAVRDTIGRRLRLVGVDEREALTLGAVLGREFAYPALAALWEGTERSLFAALDAAQDVHLVDETEDGYVFHHPLLWEVIYGGVPASRQTVLHERAGLALEHVYGSRAESHAAELASHFVAAGPGQADRAAYYLVLAGDQAGRVYAHAEAERHYRMALKLMPRVEDRGREALVQEKLGEVLRSQSRNDEALQALDEAMDLYRLLGDADGETRTVARIGHVHVARGTPEDGFQRVRGVIDGLAGRDSSLGLARAYVSLARLSGATGRHGGELVSAERAAKIAREAGNRRILAEAEGELGAWLSEVLRLDEAVRVLEEAAHLAEEEADLGILLRAQENLIGVHVNRGEVEKARAVADRAVKVADQLGDPRMIVMARCSRTQVTALTGDWDLAGADVEIAVSLGRRTHVWEDTALAIGQSGRIRLLTGEWEGARRDLEESVAMAARTHPYVLLTTQAWLAELEILLGHQDEACHRLLPLMEGPTPAEFVALANHVRPTLIWAYLELGELERAEALLTPYMIWARGTGASRIGLIKMLWLRAMAASRKKRWDEAVVALKEALPLTQNMPWPHQAGRLLTLYGQVHVHKGEPERARDRLQEALAIFRQLGAKKDVARTEQMLNRLSGLSQ